MKVSQGVLKHPGELGLQIVSLVGVVRHERHVKQLLVQIAQDLSIPQGDASEISENLGGRVAAKFLESKTLLHAPHVESHAHDCDIGLVVRVFQAAELLGQYGQLAEMSPQADLMLCPLHLAHSLALELRGSVFSHILEGLLLLVKDLEHVHFEAVKGSLLYSVGKQV